MGLGENDGGAHWEVEVQLSGLGDILDGANRPAVIHGSEEEEELGVVVTELLAAPGLVQRTRGSRPNSWHSWMGVGRSMAAANGGGASMEASAMAGNGRGGEKEKRVGTGEE